MDKISNLKKIILNTLDSNKALDIVSIDLADKSSIADYMIIASGTSSRHIQALSEQVLEKIKLNGIKNMNYNIYTIYQLPIITFFSFYFTIFNTI